MQEEMNNGTTEFNMSVMTLGRVNYSLVVCTEYRRAMNLDGWFFELQNLYLEASTEMKGDLNYVLKKYTGLDDIKTENLNDVGMDNDDFVITEKLIDKIEPLVNSYKSKPSPLNTRILFKHLQALELILRKILKSSGMLMKMKEDLFTPTQNWD